MKKFLLLLLSPSILFANSYIVEIKNDESSPSIEDIVAPIEMPPNSPPVLETLSETPPTSISYLIPQRSTGNLKKIIESNPNWSLSRLYQRVVLNIQAQ